MITTMQEELVRQELPIQSIYQREQACTATVPIHLDIMGLPEITRANPSLVANARDVVKPWYNEDMAYYINVLRKDGMELPWLEAYEKFRDDWQLDGELCNGFLSLSWRENGEVHNMRYNPIPVVLCNQHDEYGEFYTHDSLTKGGRLIEIIYRNVTDPEIVAMDPEKMRKYGSESGIARIREDEGVAEVVGNVFSSDYHMNMAKALLLRNFAVFYMNRLLTIAKGN